MYKDYTLPDKVRDETLGAINDVRLYSRGYGRQLSERLDELDSEKAGIEARNREIIAKYGEKDFDRHLDEYIARQKEELASRDQNAFDGQMFLDFGDGGEMSIASERRATVYPKKFSHDAEYAALIKAVDYFDGLDGLIDDIEELVAQKKALTEKEFDCLRKDMESLGPSLEEADFQRRLVVELRKQRVGTDKAVEIVREGESGTDLGLVSLDADAKREALEARVEKALAQLADEKTMDNIGNVYALFSKTGFTHTIAGMMKDISAMSKTVSEMYYDDFDGAQEAMGNIDILRGLVRQAYDQYSVSQYCPSPAERQSIKKILMKTIPARIERVERACAGMEMREHPDATDEERAVLQLQFEHKRNGVLRMAERLKGPLLERSTEFNNPKFARLQNYEYEPPVIRQLDDGKRNHSAVSIMQTARVTEVIDQIHNLKDMLFQTNDQLSHIKGSNECRREIIAGVRECNNAANRIEDKLMLATGPMLDDATEFVNSIFDVFEGDDENGIIQKLADTAEENGSARLFNRVHTMSDTLNNIYGCITSLEHTMEQQKSFGRKKEEMTRAEL